MRIVNRLSDLLKGCDAEGEFFDAFGTEGDGYEASLNFYDDTVSECRVMHGISGAKRVW